MTTDGYAVNTETVEEYIQNDVLPALEMFRKIVGWLEEKNPRNYGPELLTGTRPELPGAPTEFWEASELFIRRMLELYDTILQRQREVVNTLSLLDTKGQQAVAAYRKQEQDVADVFNSALHKLTEGR